MTPKGGTTFLSEAIERSPVSDSTRMSRLSPKPPR